VDGIVGRDDERAIVAQFVAIAADRPAALTIDGAPGVGKTELFRHAVGVAALAGLRVLRTSPVEQELPLTFTGLTDLLAPLETERIDDLATPQRAAIAAAILREPGGAEPPDERAIGTGLATVLNRLADEGPLLVAIDDVQWLDQSSERALRFALHRVAGPVGVLTCRRPTADRVDLAESLVDHAWRHRLELGGLSLAATFVLVRERLGVALPRTRLNQVWEVSQGNALLVLELVRTASDHHLDELLAGQLPLPDRLERLLSDRLGALSDDALNACLAVACAGRASIELLRELDLEAGLVAAERAGVLVVRPDRVRFSHPLLATGTLARVSDPECRRMHGLLAGVVMAAEARARHLALADPAPSAGTATALDAAAAEALQRGSIASAVELARLAVERTPPDDVVEGWSRKITLATSLFAAGESAAAAEQLADRAESCPSGRLRAEAELLMVEVEYAASTAFSAAAIAREAVTHAGDDPRLRARALLSLAAVDPKPDDTPRLIREARSCLATLDPPDHLALGWAMALDSGHRIIAGEPVDPAEIHAAVDVERTGRVWRSSDYAASVRPVQLRWIDESEAGLVALAELEQRAELEGNEGNMPYVLGHRVTCLLALARFREAGDVAHRHLEHAEATGQDGQRVQALYLVGCAEAYLGNLPVARAAAEAALEAITAWDEPWMLAGASGICGAIELALGEPERARRHLDRWRAESRRAGIAGPPISPFDVDHLEALLGCHDRAAAGSVTDELVAVADRAGRRSAQAAGQHCRALLAAHDGDLYRAIGHLDSALSFDGKALNDFSRGRVLVLQGVLHRRLKQKAAARASLERARELFQSTGSAHWLVVADGELARLGQRRGDGLTLTDTERRVAELASQGMTNREVAERAFVSPKTVEANLARVYRKLGIRSRAELGALMAAQARTET
jgi:DNA-binding CsgD family transcriptional regulator